MPQLFTASLNEQDVTGNKLEAPNLLQFRPAVKVTQKFGAAVTIRRNYQIFCLIAGLQENLQNGERQFDHCGSYGDRGNGVHPTRKGEIKKYQEMHSGLDLNITTAEVPPTPGACIKQKQGPQNLLRYLLLQQHENFVCIFQSLRVL